MDLDQTLLKRHLRKAIILGLVMGFLIMVVWVNFIPRTAKQSFEFWTQEAQPFHINDQYRVDGDSVWTVELENGGNTNIDLFSVDVSGEGTSTHWAITNASRFDAQVSKILLIPIKKPCQKNETYTYSLNITYAPVGHAQEIEVGKYPIFGRCI